MHVIALVNTLNLTKLGHLGQDQLDFIKKDTAPLSNDTPVIVFSHIPLFAMYPDWGWGTDDAIQALSYLRRFSSVTCLNGHVHQVFSKTDGNVTFFSATTTAYPLPHPGDGPAPKPLAWYRLSIAADDGQLVVDLADEVEQDFRLTLG